MLKQNIFRDYFDTPLGKMEVTTNQQAVLTIKFVKQPEPDTIHKNEVTDLTIHQMLEYYASERIQFDLPLLLSGTSFQKRVWSAVTFVHYGETCSYADIADTIKNPNAVRAVGAAIGNNPIAIIVPCHRVIGSNGKLTGYAYGLNKKAWLLNHESNSF